MKRFPTIAEVTTSVLLLLAAVLVVGGCASHDTSADHTLNTADVEPSHERSPDAINKTDGHVADETTKQNETSHEQPADTAESSAPALPGITFFLERGYVELDAVVVGREAEWLELVACTPGTREHEALVTVSATPSDLHLALLLLGVEPGRPQRGVRGEDGWRILPASGGRVALEFVIHKGADGEPAVVPAGAWVLDLDTGAPLDTRLWMFTGSRLLPNPDDPEGPAVYLADVNGTVASLVHFGDETLSMDTTKTQDTDGQSLAPHPDRMPPDGAAVKLRVSVVATGFAANTVPDKLQEPR